jgi:hypothetical protein
LVYGKEAVMPMEFILPSLHIATITELSDTSAIEERLAQLVQLEEDQFVTVFISKFIRLERNLGMINTSNIKSFKWEIWYYSMTISSCNIQKV